ncbi:hypothetical protein AYI69_g1833, partial [Smittium culicis]
MTNPQKYGICCPIAILVGHLAVFAANSVSEIRLGGELFMLIIGCGT